MTRIRWKELIYSVIKVKAPLRRQLGNKSPLLSLQRKKKSSKLRLRVSESVTTSVILCHQQAISLYKELRRA